jgi:hypothetical protein
LVSKLGIENVGEIAKLEQNSARLNDKFQLADAPELMVLYLKMQSFEKEYLLIRQDSKMQSVYEAAQQLRNNIVLSSRLDSIGRAETFKDLDAYELVAKEIVKLNKKIISKIRKSGDVDDAVVSNKLLEVANSEVERGRLAIDGKIEWAKVLLVSAVLVTLSLAGAIAKQFASALRALAEEQGKSERLLLNILPPLSAQELKREERTIADSFAEATVMFADIVGFTELAAQTEPTELVEILNLIFSEFDQLTEEHGLEKIKTIGDAYMVVGGLPVQRPNHAEAMRPCPWICKPQLLNFAKIQVKP